VTVELVVDSNILLSALLKPSITQKLLFSEKIRLFAPEHCLEEIERHSTEFTARMGKSKEEFRIVVAVIFSEVTIIPSQEYRAFKKQAMGLLSDKTDWPFLALALSKHLPIWSNDKGFKRQSGAKAFNTKELLQKLGVLPSHF